MHSYTRTLDARVDFGLRMIPLTCIIKEERGVDSYEIHIYTIYNELNIY